MKQDDLLSRKQARAYELWETSGRPAGRELEHWLMAEQEVSKGAAAANKPMNAVAPPPVAKPAPKRFGALRGRRAS